MALTPRRLLKGIAWVPLALAAAVLLAALRLRLVSFITASRVLAPFPGAGGILLRRIFFRWTLAACGDDLVVDWMAVLKTPTIRIGTNVFIGSFCFVAECELHDDVQIAHHAVIQGGGHTHGFDRIGIPMSRQSGDIRAVSIGPDVWIGTGARILNDVAPGTVVGAGAVVTRRFEPNAILAGVPARVVRLRGARE